MMLASSLRRASHAPWFTSMVTVALLVLMLVIGAFGYDGFLSPQVMLNLLIDNAFLLVVAIGMTFVILSGGIDLSVGSVLALTTMVAAFLLQSWHWPPLLVIATVLLMGAGFGAAMGAMIHYFKLQAFIVTLAGMFLARGLCYLISINSITIDEPLFVELSQSRLEFGGLFISPSVVIALIVLAVAIWMAHGTRFGRAVYAIGGSESSALLMGCRSGAPRFWYMPSADSVHRWRVCCSPSTCFRGTGCMRRAWNWTRLRPWSSGTLLTGGYGYVAGTLTGVLILGVIQTLIAFDGSLSSWWTKIFIGALLFVFCVAQRVISLGALRGKSAGSAKAAPAVA